MRKTILIILHKICDVFTVAEKPNGRNLKGNAMLQKHRKQTRIAIFLNFTEGNPEENVNIFVTAIKLVFFNLLVI